jgi:oligopeptide transport system substrate-binding protein
MRKHAALLLMLLLIPALLFANGTKEEEHKKDHGTSSSATEKDDDGDNKHSDATSSASKKEVVFRIANTAEVESLDPSLVSGTPESRVLSGLFEGLVAADPKDASAVPGVAESWESNSDGTQYTFHLRKDALWSDGTPVTAQDVVYSWLRILNPATGSPYAWFPAMFLKGAAEYNEGSAPASSVQIRALDDSTFQMDLVGPLPYVLDALSHYSFAIVPEHVVKKYGTDWTKPEHIVGNGPFVLTEHLPETSLTMVKSNTYWDKENVHLNKVVFYASDKDTTTYNMYLNGELDWDVSIPPDQLKAASMRSDFQSTPYLSTQYYLYNMFEGPTSDVRIRKALSLAVDRQALVDQVTQGGEVPAWGIVPPMAGYDAIPVPNDGDMEKNISEAKALLADAGYPSGVGFPTLTIIYNTSEYTKKIAEFIQYQWKEHLGINVKLENQEWQTFLTNKNSGKFQVVRAGWVGDYQDPNTFLDMFVTGGAQNGGRYSNKKFDALIHQAAQMPAGKERTAVLHQADEILITEDMAVLPLYSPVTSTLIDTSKWGGWYDNVMASHPLKNIYQK